MTLVASIGRLLKQGIHQGRSLATAGPSCGGSVFRLDELVQMRPWSHLGVPSGGRPRIAVGMSGGVDSSVAAFLLKEQGCDVFGVFMKTWDALEEGEASCTFEKDLTDARDACSHLKIPLVEADFVPQYWQNVFGPFIDQCSLGLTPNPDLYCNAFVKFGSLMGFVLSQGADGLATGHYARTRFVPANSNSNAKDSIQLLRGVDLRKDQTYFLSKLRQDQLAKAVFPIGTLGKDQVRKLATHIGLPNAQRRSSAGICFVGRRKFPKFLEQYIQPSVGDFVSVVSGNKVGTHNGIQLYTCGQRARISGAEQAWYVVGKDATRNEIFVAEGQHHSALYSSGAFLKDLHWISGVAPDGFDGAESNELRCTFKARYLQRDVGCTLLGPSSSSPDMLESHKRSRYCVMKDEGSQSTGDVLPVLFDSPARAITPEQAFVLYDGDVCLGSALIDAPTTTCYERGEDVLSHEVEE